MEIISYHEVLIHLGVFPPKKNKQKNKKNISVKFVEINVPGIFNKAVFYVLLSLFSIMGFHYYFKFNCCTRVQRDNNHIKAL